MKEINLICEPKKPQKNAPICVQEQSSVRYEVVLRCDN